MIDLLDYIIYFFSMPHFIPELIGILVVLVFLRIIFFNKIYR